MNEREFCLLDEPWILVMRNDGVIEEVSLKDVFKRAGEFSSLAGELPTQNAAMLRLLLAILHTVIARYDEHGEKTELEDGKDAEDRWLSIWKARRLPIEAIDDYLETYRSRFWLFDGERPFYQVPLNDAMAKATVYKADKLNQEISEGNNPASSRFFLQRTGHAREEVSYGEAARWLVCMMAYDTAVKVPSERKKEILAQNSDGNASGSKCWLSSFTVIMAEGSDLFETMMLNTVLDTNTCEECDVHSSWEDNEAATQICVERPHPADLAALYTMQTRRIILKREGGKVIGFKAACGEFFSGRDAFIEPMTAWRRNEKENYFFPAASRHERQMWRDLSALVAEREGERRPGIVSWLNYLVVKKFISKKQLRLATVSTEYDSMGYVIKNILSDKLSFSAAMLSEKGDGWIPTIIDEIETADRLARQLGTLSRKIACAAGDSDGDTAKKAAEEHAYFNLDMPFREWLESIDPEKDDKQEASGRWWDLASGIIRSLGKELVLQAGPQAITGRIVLEKAGNSEREIIYTAPGAYNDFLYWTKTRELLRSGGKKNG